MSEPAASATRKCINCNTENPAENSFCGKCGNALDPAISAVTEYLDSHLKTRIDSVLKERFRDQSVVETEISTKVAEKLYNWAKLFGVYIGVPLIAASAYLAWLGFDVNHSLGILREKLVDVANSSDELKKTVNSVQIRTNELNHLNDDLQKKITASSASLQHVPELAGLVSRLNDRIASTGKQLPELQSKGNALGVDVSHFTGSLPATALKKVGASFVYVKSSGGSTFVDPMFVPNCKAARDAGLACGAYHVLSAGDPEGQVRLFIEQLGKTPLDLPPAIDFEPSVSGKNPSLQDLEAFAIALTQRYGCTPVIYGGNMLLRLATTRDTKLGRYPLWIAQYGVSPKVRAPWNDWTFWQFTNGSLTGGRPAMSFNAFNGTAAELKAFSSKSCASRKP